MKKYLIRKASMINGVKRGLLKSGEVINSLIGYLQCMVDLGELSEDRLSDEITMMTKEVLSL